MNNFELLGKHISEIDEVLETWIKQKFSLNYNHFAVLYCLAGAENGQCTQKQICDEWYMPKQTVFNICKEFREKGWIEFYPSPTDKRERIMQLTNAGNCKQNRFIARRQKCLRTHLMYLESRNLLNFLH